MLSLTMIYTVDISWDVSLLNLSHDYKQRTIEIIFGAISAKLSA